MPAEIFVGAGSNIDPERHLRAALAAIRDRFGAVTTSAVYRSAAVGFSGDDFLNVVMRLQAPVGPAELQRFLSRVEQACGRQRTARSKGAQPVGPRVLDLDLLLYGSLVDPDLRVPRHDVLRYAFVLRPLSELAPQRVHPVTGRTLRAEWLAAAGRSPGTGALHLTAPGL